MSPFKKHISSCIKKLDIKKAIGIDAMPPKIIKADLSSLSLPICNVADTILSKQTIPS